MDHQFTTVRHSLIVFWLYFSSHLFSFESESRVIYRLPDETDLSCYKSTIIKLYLFKHDDFIYYLIWITWWTDECGSPGAVVKLPANWIVADRGLVPRSSIQDFEKRNMYSLFTRYDSVLWNRKPPWPRGSVLGLRPPGLRFIILCLENSVIWVILPPSGDYPGPFQPMCPKVA